MMRNSINSYLTTLVMVLALLFSANAFATETVQSTIEIDNNQYALYTGFTATAGSEAPSGYVLQNMVDGDLTTGWNTAPSVSEDYASRGYAYFEFSSDVPIVLKGYVLNSHRASGYHPTDRRLYAKANEDDEYALVSSYTNEDYSGTQNSFPIANEDNKPYRYFRFEGTNSVQHVWLHEIRLYGGRELTYVFMPKKSATCTATGIKQACYLRSDGKYFTDETGAADLSKEDVIEPLKPHNIIHHEEDDVYYERWQCSVCGKFFKNAEGTEEISDMVLFTKYRRVAVASEYRTLIQIMSSLRNDLSDQITGDIVSFVVAEKYIDVNSIKVSDGVNDYPITSEGNGYYSFTVPAANVTISAEKKPKYEDVVFFDLERDVDGKLVVTDVFHSGLSTVKLNSSIDYKIDDGTSGFYVKSLQNMDAPFTNVEGRFIGLSTRFSVPETGWYDISFNEAGDDKWNLSISATTRKPQIETISDQVYTGEDIMPKPVVTLDFYDLTEGTDYEYSYSNNVNVGSSATVTVTFKGDYAEFGFVSKSFNITKATPTVEPPTSANPKFAGTCVALVTAGSTNFGTMLYSLDDDDDYSENIPCADKGGDYTVYYKVEESDNWSDAAGSVEIQVPVRVDVTVVGDGSVSGYDPDEFYPVGTVLTLTAEPDEDYRFTGWDDDFDAPAERVWTVLADAKDNELTVNFQQKTVCYGAVCVYNNGINEVEATIDGDSNIPWSIPEEIRVQRVNLNRNFARQGFSTIVLPFDFEEIEVDEAEFYELDGVSFANDKWNVSVTPVSEVRPNTPYLIHVMKNNVSFSGDIALRPIDDDVDCSVTKNGWELCGTYEYKVWKDGNPELGRVYGFAAEERDGARIGQFVRLAYNASAKPLRAYLRYVGSPRPAPALFKAAPAVASIDELPESMDVVIRGEEGTTVIGTINTRTGEFRSADNRWFDLNGRYLGNKKPSVKGTYYNNGKKVIVK